MDAREGPCELTLITPMYNESAQIERSLRSILAALEELHVTWEYILVDDGSTDDSLQKARAAIGDHPSCRIIQYQPNRGRGYALRQGFAAARGRYVVTTESDLSWGAEIVAKLYDTLRTTQADVAIASVHLPGGRMENVPFFRRALSAGGNKLVRWAFGGALTMLTGMTRGYRREAIETLHLEEDRKEVHLEIVAKAQALGFRIVEIPATLHWEPPGEDRPERAGRGISRFILSHLVLSFQHASVKLLSILAAVTGFTGILLVVVGTFNKIFHFLPYLLPYLVTYGLILCILAMLFLLFALVSIQLKFVYRSVVHLQSQLKSLQDAVDRRREGENQEGGG